MCGGKCSVSLKIDILWIWVQHLFFWIRLRSPRFCLCSLAPSMPWQVRFSDGRYRVGAGTATQPAEALLTSRCLGAGLVAACVAHSNERCGPCVTSLGSCRALQTSAFPGQMEAWPHFIPGWCAMSPMSDHTAGTTRLQAYECRQLVSVTDP